MIEKRKAMLYCPYQQVTKSPPCSYWSLFSTSFLNLFWPQSREKLPPIQQLAPTETLWPEEAGTKDTDL